MGPPSCMRSVVDRNVVIRRITAQPTLYGVSVHCSVEGLPIMRVLQLRIMLK